MPEQTRRDLKLHLAEQLIVQAEHSSEIEMRLSISRIYYAAYHVAAVACGRSVKSHGHFRPLLNDLAPGLGDEFDWLRTLRAGADYNPSFVAAEFSNLEEFRSQFPAIMERARELYRTLIGLAGDGP